jgi:hypothetical protein
MEKGEIIVYPSEEIDFRFNELHYLGTLILKHEYI